MAVADLADRGEVAGRRHEDAVGAGHGLEDDGGDRLRTFVPQDLLQVRAAGGDRAVRARLMRAGGAAVRVRVEHAHDAGDRRLGRPAPRVAGERRGARRGAVIAAVAGDDLLAPGHPARQLDGVLVGVGAAGGEQRHAEVARRHLGEQPGELRPRLAGEGRRQAVQRLRLAPHRLDQPRVPVAEVQVHHLRGEVPECRCRSVRRRGVPEPPPRAALAAGDAQRLGAALGAPRVDDGSRSTRPTLSRRRGRCTATRPPTACTHRRPAWRSDAPGTTG